MPDYILAVSPPVTTTVRISLQIPNVIPEADFSSALNSQYAFLFNMAGFTPDLGQIPIADFSESDNSQYAFLFNFAGLQGPEPTPNLTMLDFTNVENSGYIAFV